MRSSIGINSRANLFLIYVNDFPPVSTLLDKIMFANDTNSFYSHKDLKFLFKTMNNRLYHIKKWFNAHKLSLNHDKKITFSHKLSRKDGIPLKLPVSRIDKTVIEITRTWNRHIDYINSQQKYKNQFNILKVTLSERKKGG